MKFALLGCDPDTLELALEVARHPAHALVWAHDSGDREPTIRAAAPGIVSTEHWEGLLGGTIADVVLISRANDEELRAEQLRKLAQTGTAMIVSHPVVDSMLLYYELDMIRQGSRCQMLPYVSQRWHPAWSRLGELVRQGAAGPIGVVEQVVVEHVLPSRGRGEVMCAFVRDMEMVRPLCGVLNKVSAMTSSGVRVSAESINYGTLSVQMSSLSNVLVRWSVAVADQSAGSDFTFIGTRGKLTLVAPQAGAWRLELNGDGRITTEHFDEALLAATALPRLLEALAGGAAASNCGQAGLLATVPDWLDACHTMELADAAQHSLERGRTIELHYEAPSEHSTFKGVMSGVGCLLLGVGLLVLIVATTAVHAGVPLADYWPQMLLGVLVAFLLLQLLRLVFPSEPKPRRKASGDRHQAPDT